MEPASKCHRDSDDVASPPPAVPDSRSPPLRLERIPKYPSGHASPVVDLTRSGDDREPQTRSHILAVVTEVAPRDSYPEADVTVADSRISFSEEPTCNHDVGRRTRWDGELTGRTGAGTRVRRSPPSSIRDRLGIPSDCQQVE